MSLNGNKSGVSRLSSVWKHWGGGCELKTRSKSQTWIVKVKLWDQAAWRCLKAMNLKSSLIAYKVARKQIQRWTTSKTSSDHLIYIYICVCILQLLSVYLIHYDVLEHKTTRSHWHEVNCVKIVWDFTHSFLNTQRDMEVNCGMADPDSFNI